MSKNTIKIALDIVMTVILILLMNSASTGILWHEILGLSIFGVFFIHKLLNRQWLKEVTRLLFKGKCKSKTEFMYILDSLLLVSVTMTVISGILISQAILPFLASKNLDMWSALHTSFAYISLILTSVHLGVHWKYIMSAFRKTFSIRRESRARTIILRAVAVILVIIGIKTSFENNVSGKLLAPLTLSNKEYKTAISSLYNTTELYDTSKLSANIKLVSVDTSSDNAVSLEDYLGKLVCTACGHHCSLLNPRCGRGERQVQAAEQEYYSSLEQTQSGNNAQNETETHTVEDQSRQSQETIQSKESTSSGTQDDNNIDDTTQDNRQSQGDSTIENESDMGSVFLKAGNGGEVLDAFTEFIPLMTIYVAGTYYTVEFILPFILYKRKQTQR